jgi:hypothetical protein
VTRICYCLPEHKPKEGHTGACEARNQYEEFRASRSDVPPRWEELSPEERERWSVSALAQLIGLI